MRQSANLVWCTVIVTLRGQRNAGRTIIIGVRRWYVIALATEAWYKVPPKPIKTTGFAEGSDTQNPLASGSPPP